MPSPAPLGGPAPLDILIVEDDEVLRDVLRLQLEAQGWRARCAADGPAALAACAERRPDVVLLDLGLPGPSGIEVCAALRATHRPPPGIIMVTARNGELDVLLGLEIGADDYVTKPFRPREIAARVSALCRRLGRPDPGRPAGLASDTPAASESPRPAPEVLVRGHLRIDTGSWRVTVGGRPVPLTPMELGLLLCLARTPDRVYSRGQLLAAASAAAHEGYERTIDSHINRLRRKLAEAGLDPSPIETVHGIGYRFATDEAC